MDSFHRSRARIFFELLCALGISASLVGAWQQTYADALLAAAGFTGLYALALLFDLLRRRPAMRAAEASDVARPVVATTPAAVETAESEAEPAAPAPRAKVARKPRASRKQAKAAPAIEAEVVRITPPAPETDEVVADDETAHVPPAPLFEPEPFVRQQQRALFGRKAG